MKTLTFAQDPNDSRLGPEHSTHYFARLMTPQEVAHATLGQPSEVKRSTAGHWVLAGDVSASMFQLLKRIQAKNFPARITCFSSPAGYGYLTLTHQVETFQHRFLLSLTDPAVNKFLCSISNTGKVTFSLGNDDGWESILLPNPLLPHTFVPVLAMAPEVNAEVQSAALTELHCAQVVMGDPIQVPSLIEGLPVKHACVSLLLPEILNEKFKNTVREAAQA